MTTPKWNTFARARLYNTEHTGQSKAREESSLVKNKAAEELVPEQNHGQRGQNPDLLLWCMILAVGAAFPFR